MPETTGGRSRGWRTLAVLLFALGFVLQLWLWSRGAIPIGYTATSEGTLPCAVSRDGGRGVRLADQLAILAPGILLARDGEVLPYGKRVSGGSILPGALLQLLVGFPLMLRYDYLAASSVLLVIHFVAGLLVWRVVREAGGERLGALLLAVFWLSPWRLYHSGFLWEPAYVVLLAAVHLWASWRLRSGASALAGPSLWLGGSLVLGIQVHLSAAFFVFVTAIQLRRRLIAVRWAWLLGGGVVGALTLWPTVSAWLAGQLSGAGPTSGFVGRGFVYVYPLLRGLVYWVRMSSFDTGQRIREATSHVGSDLASGSELAPIVIGLVVALSALGWASALVSAVANYATLRRQRQRGAPTPGVEFLSTYSRVAIAGLVVAVGLSWVTPQSFQLQVVVVAACLPVAVWLERQLVDGGRWLRALVVAFVCFRLPVTLVLGLGHPVYAEPPTGPCLPFGVWAERMAERGHPVSEVDFVPRPSPSAEDRRSPVR